MTVDMLAAAFIWPEEILVGRNHIGDDPPREDDRETDASLAAPESEPVPFWAALLRRFRVESGVEAR